MDGLRRSYNSPESNAVDDTEIKLGTTNVVIREEEEHVMLESLGMTRQENVK